MGVYSYEELNKAHWVSYRDPEYRAYLDQHSPDWLEKALFLKRAKADKEKALKMAMDGKRPPRHGTALRRFLDKYYLNPKSILHFDARFARKLRKIRPDWFQE